jgi:hypothetical protein
VSGDIEPDRRVRAGCHVAYLPAEAPVLRRPESSTIGWLLASEADLAAAVELFK